MIQTVIIERKFGRWSYQQTWQNQGDRTNWMDG